MPHGTFLIEWRQEDPPWVWTTPACDSPHERMWEKEAFALLPAFPHDCWRVYLSHSWVIPLLGLEPTLLGFQLRLCGVSLFLMVYWPLGYEDKGSRRSQQGLAGCECDGKNLLGDGFSETAQLYSRERAESGWGITWSVLTVCFL